MSKQTSKKKTGLIIAAGSVGSVVLGWAINKYGKGPIKEVYANLNQKVTETTDKWYADGERKAQSFETIKNDIDMKL